MALGNYPAKPRAAVCSIPCETISGMTPDAECTGDHGYLKRNETRGTSCRELRVVTNPRGSAGCNHHASTTLHIGQHWELKLSLEFLLRRPEVTSSPDSVWSSVLGTMFLSLRTVHSPPCGLELLSTQEMVPIKTTPHNETLVIRILVLETMSLFVFILAAHLKR